MPPKRERESKKKETKQTTISPLNHLFYFGPQPTEKNKVTYTFNEFTKAEPEIPTELPKQKKIKKEKKHKTKIQKPFSVPYSEHGGPIPKSSIPPKILKQLLLDSIKVKYETEDFDFSSFILDKRTLIENRMIEMSNAIRNKPDWQTKIKNKDIVSKWMQEFEEQSKPPPTKYKKKYRTKPKPIVPVTKAMVDYVIAELDYFSSLSQDDIQISSVNGVWQSDALISDELLKSLKEGVSVLENIPEHLKDWHPDSGSKVLDLVHPSLFCWVNGITPVFHPSLKTYQRHFAEIQSTNFTRSLQYQWLPSDFFVDDDGEVSILSYIFFSSFFFFFLFSFFFFLFSFLLFFSFLFFSFLSVFYFLLSHLYINNLDPVVHKSLYDTIGKIFSKFIPLFERVLGNLISPLPQVPGLGQMYYVLCESYFQDKAEEEEYTETQNEPEAEIGKFNPKSYKRSTINLNGRTLQVIVKLANIELTPESPSYPGGSWHVEGMQNENIVASGIYYYESENITESVLNFRVACSMPDFGYDTNGSIHQALEKVYGINNDDALNDPMGGLITKSGRAIAFPNVYQHQVAPFELEDKKKKGVRKILVFFLVDPYDERILSTYNVPPQQKSWALKELAPIFHTLPKPKIVSYLPMMDIETAKKHRKQLMAERKTYVAESDQHIYNRQFSLCEH